MSCGKPHATPCTDVLSYMYVYIDQEIDEHHRIEVHAHLAECAPCEGRFATAIAIHARVRRTQPDLTAPASLRAAIIAQIRRGNPAVE